MKFRLSRRPATEAMPGVSVPVAGGTERELREITASHRPCETAENGTGARCACSFDCANYRLRAKGHRQENG